MRFLTIRPNTTVNQKQVTNQVTTDSGGRSPRGGNPAHDGGSRHRLAFSARGCAPGSISSTQDRGISDKKGSFKEGVRLLAERGKVSIQCGGCSYMPFRPFYCLWGGSNRCATSAVKKRHNYVEDFALELMNINQSRKDWNKVQGLVSGAGTIVTGGVILGIFLGSLTFGIGTAVVLGLGIMFAIGMGISGLIKQSQDPAGLVHMACSPSEMIKKGVIKKGSGGNSYSVKKEHDRKNIEKKEITEVLKLHNAILVAYLAKEEVSKSKKWYRDWVNGQVYLKKEVLAQKHKALKNEYLKVKGQDDFVLDRSSMTRITGPIKQEVSSGLFIKESGKDSNSEPEEVNLKQDLFDSELKFNEFLIEKFKENKVARFFRPLQTAFVILSTALRGCGIPYISTKVELALLSATSLVFLPLSPIFLGIGFLSSGIEFSKSWITKYRIINAYKKTVEFVKEWEKGDIEIRFNQEEANRLKMFVYTSHERDNQAIAGC